MQWLILPASSELSSKPISLAISRQLLFMIPDLTRIFISIGERPWPLFLRLPLASLSCPSQFESDSKSSSFRITHFWQEMRSERIHASGIVSSRRIRVDCLVLPISNYPFRERICHSVTCHHSDHNRSRLPEATSQVSSRPFIRRYDSTSPPTPHTAQAGFLLNALLSEKLNVTLTCLCGATRRDYCFSADWTCQRNNQHNKRGEQDQIQRTLL